MAFSTGSGIPTLVVRRSPDQDWGREGGCSLTVVIPAFNEEGRLPATILAIQQHLVRQGYDWELLIVDDGSRDRTREVAQKVAAGCPAIRVIHNEENHGKGYAVRTGVMNATKAAILFSDADLSTPIEEVEWLFREFADGAAVVIASRHLEGASHLVQQSVRRRWMGRVFGFLVSLLGLRGFRDTQCGFKLFRADVARSLFAPLKTMGFALDVEILLRARAMGHRTAEVPVRWIEASGSHVDPIRDSVRMLWDVIRIRCGF